MDLMHVVEIVSGVWIVIALGMATLVMRDMRGRFR
jgi:hypothetical protein